jgi:hypothetical protein
MGEAFKAFHELGHDLENFPGLTGKLRVVFGQHAMVLYAGFITHGGCCLASVVVEPAVLTGLRRY